jgi:hypothetical protein
MRYLRVTIHITIDPGFIDFTLTHEEIVHLAFRLSRRLDRAWEKYTVERENRRERVRTIVGMYGVRRAGNKKSQSKGNDYDTVERTSMKVKDFKRVIPKTMVVTTYVNGQPVRTLLDPGSEADFISTTLVDQLKVERDILAKPLRIRMAIKGSLAKTNYLATVTLQYQEINEQRRLDVSNVDGYDLVLGMPFLWQHSVMLGFNPARVYIGSADSQEMKGDEVYTVSSAAADVFEEDLDRVRDMLKAEAADLCPDTSKTALLPFRDVNHVIPIIDEGKVYRYRPARCLEALKPLWREKKEAYLRNGRWKIATGNPSSLLLVLPKPPKASGEMRIRTVLDKREQNANM